VRWLAGNARAGLFLIHDYEFRNNFHDQLGGPDLVPDGGSLDPVKGYHFGNQQGLSLSGGIDSSVYEIDIHFSLTLTGSSNGWDKIVDYHNKGPRPGGSGDDGLYWNPFHNLDWYPYASGPYTYSANTLVTVSTTRDSSGTITGSVNGAQQFSFTDSSNFGVFNGPNNIVWFFEDDRSSASGENSAGFVDQILIYGPNQVIPEPSTLSLLALGAVGWAGHAWRRRRRPV
jgi:hypothetical protein